MTYPGKAAQEVWTGRVEDAFLELPVISSEQRYEGHVWTIRTDTVDVGGHVVSRDVVVHTGAVAVLALNDSDNVYLLRQYRHPAGMALFEPPAGLLDVDGEPPLETAKREFAEEAGLVADSWHVLADFFNSPGGSTEILRIYLAQEVTPRPGGRVHTGEAEEVDMPGAWISLEEAVGLVLEGRLANPTAVVGILAAAAAKNRGWSSLRPADAPWPVRDYLVATGRVRTGGRIDR
ncbi:MAG: NUDIX hydrolase [Candidatus Nanopelagicales bacterium]